jgi:hypothetical protein
MKTATQKAASRPGLGLGEGVLVDRQWLDAHLLDPRVRVVEVDVSPVAYSGYRYLMQALAAQDNLAEALSVYGQLSECLRDQLGVSPSPAPRIAGRQLTGAGERTI